MTKGSSDTAYSIIFRKISFILTENLFISGDFVFVGKRFVAIITVLLEFEAPGFSEIVILYGQKLMKSGSRANIFSAILKLQNNITSFLGNIFSFLSCIASPMFIRLIIRKLKSPN